MGVMAIDHAAYFIAKEHMSEFWGVALPRYDAAGVFLTRWVTHPCAPGFFFLMGAGMALFAASRKRLGWSRGRIARYFLVRGLLLVALEHVVVNPAWLLGSVAKSPNVIRPPGGGGMPFACFGVLFALGGAMAAWGLLLRLPGLAAAALGAAAIGLTGVLVPPAAQADVLYSPALRLLLIAGQTGPVLVFYPLLPWFGVTGLGLAFGRLLLRDPRRAYRAAAACGAGLLLLFVLVRWAGRFGNLHPPAEGVIGFLNVTKYPPSVAFLLLTLGIDLLLLAALAAVQGRLGRLARPLVTLGRTALFFYVAHLFLYGLVGLAFPRGTSLSVTYAVWLAGLIALLPACRRYQRFKGGTPPASIWRLF